MSRRLRPHLALITVQLLFGAWPIFGKMVLRSLSPTSLVVCRLVGAAVVFGLAPATINSPLPHAAAAFLVARAV